MIAHRITWSCLFILAWMLARARAAQSRGHLHATGRCSSRLLLTALLISTNWLVYVWGVSHGHIVDTSLGYYINPLINVVLGIFVLHERLNPVQWTAVALAAVAVAYVTYEAGQLPVDRTHARLRVLPLRPGAQAHQRGGPPRARHRDGAAAAARGHVLLWCGAPGSAPSRTRAAR